MKRCRKCGNEKELDDFYRHPKMADGYLNICMVCVKQLAKEHREKNLGERIR